MSHYDAAEIAGCDGASVDDLGEVVVILDISAGENAGGAPVSSAAWCPGDAELQERPGRNLHAFGRRAGSHQHRGCRCHPEAWPTEPGETQGTHSTGTAASHQHHRQPSKLGQKATLAVACETDTADAGTLRGDDCGRCERLSPTSIRAFPLPDPAAHRRGTRSG